MEKDSNVEKQFLEITLANTRMFGSTTDIDVRMGVDQDLGNDFLKRFRR